MKLRIRGRINGLLRTAQYRFFYRLMAGGESDHMQYEALFRCFLGFKRFLLWEGKALPRTVAIPPLPFRQDFDQ